MRLHFSLPNNLDQLQDELIAAIPALAPAPLDNPIFPGAMQPVMYVQGKGNDVWLDVPDNTNAVAINNVVAAHVPKPSPRVGQHAADVQLLKAAAASSPVHAALARLLGVI